MSRRSVLAALAVVLAVLAPAGCAVESPDPSQSHSHSPSAAQSPSSPGEETSVTPSDSPSPSGPSGTPGAEGPAAAINDLAKRLSVEPAEIAVVSAQEVTWSDGSLGCPEPGMNYAQVLTEGSLIVLESGGRRYEYHSAAGKPPFYCENPKPPVR